MRNFKSLAGSKVLLCQLRGHNTLMLSIIFSITTVYEWEICGWAFVEERSRHSAPVKHRTLQKHNSHWWQMHMMCKLFNCRSEQFPALTECLCRKDSRTRSSCVRLHMHKQPVLLYCKVRKEYSETICQTPTNGLTNYHTNSWRIRSLFSTSEQDISWTCGHQSIPNTYEISVKSCRRRIWQWWISQPI